MWTPLNQTDKVAVGETLRYQSNSNSLLPEDTNYVVVRTDQHCFEIVEKKDNKTENEPPRHKAVRYTDIGYNVFLERWSDVGERTS